MAPKMPLISIGMPLYNEEKYLRETLNSVLIQDLGDFELIISDNASEDATQKICLDYAAKDSRIRYYRNDVNQGPVENSNRLFRLSSAKYFVWVAGHDLWAPTFLRRCVNVLEADPSAVLCYPCLQFIDEAGKKLEGGDTYIDTRNRGLLLRFNMAVWQPGSGFMVNGVMRSHALQQTRLFRTVYGPDRLLLIELSMLGSFAHIPEILFYARDRVRERKRSYKEYRRRYMEVLYPQRKGVGVWQFPHVASTYEQMLAVKHTRLAAGPQIVLMACAIIGYFARFYRWLPATLRRFFRGLLQRTLGGVVFSSKTGLSS